MSLTTFKSLLEAPTQRVRFCRTTSLNIGATLGRWGSYYAQAGDPAGVGGFSVGNTANGLVPVSGQAGFPTIFPWGGGNIGYLTKVEISTASQDQSRFMIYDRLFHAGAYNFNDSISLSSQPSYSGRLPLNLLGSPDYGETQLWVEVATTFVGVFTVAVTYTNQDGVAGHTTGTFATWGGTTAPLAGAMFQLPLATGDYGIQKVESVISTVASVGTFNVLVIRPLLKGRLKYTTCIVLCNGDLTGLPQIFQSSALQIAHNPDSATNPTFDAIMTVVNG